MILVRLALKDSWETASSPAVLMTIVGGPHPAQNRIVINKKENIKYAAADR